MKKYLWSFVALVNICVYLASVLFLLQLLYTPLAGAFFLMIGNDFSHNFYILIPLLSSLFITLFSSFIVLSHYKKKYIFLLVPLVICIFFLFLGFAFWSCTYESWGMNKLTAFFIWVYGVGFFVLHAVFFSFLWYIFRQKKVKTFLFFLGIFSFVALIFMFHVGRYIFYDVRLQNMALDSSSRVESIVNICDKAPSFGRERQCWEVVIRRFPEENICQQVGQESLSYQYCFYAEGIVEKGSMTNLLYSVE